VRTVQRWELEEGLPVHRLQLQQRGSVFAYEDELDSWWASRSQRLSPQLIEPVAVPSRPKPNRAWLILVLAVLVPVVVLAVRTGAVRRVPGQQFPIPLTTFERAESDPSLSPDGNAFAFSWAGTPGNIDIYVKPTPGASLRRLSTHPAPDFSAKWSPDGKTIAFWRKLPGEASELLLVPAHGGPERSLGEFEGPVMGNMKVPGPYHEWTPDNRGLIIAALNRQSGQFQLTHLSLDNEKQTALPPPPQGVLGDAGPAISPDGKRLVFHRFIGQGTSQLYLVGLGGGAEKALTFDQKFNAGPAWINSQEIAFYGYRFGEMHLLRMNVNTPGEVAVVPGGAFGMHPSYSPAKRRLAFTVARPNSDLWRIPLSAAGVAAGPGYEFVPSSRQEAVPAYSPDGQSLVFTSARAGYPNVWICETAATDRCEQITHFESSLTGPSSWSPDGRSLALSSNQGGSHDLYVVSASPGSKPRPLLSGPTDESFPFWSHDGHWIYFTSNRTGRFEIWRIKPDGSALTQLTTEGGYIPVESYDGHWLYYAKDNNEITSLWRRSLSGEPKDARIVEKSRIWFAAGRNGLYFNSVQPRQVWYWDALTGSTRAAIDLPFSTFLGIAVSPDERELCVSVGKPGNGDIMMFENFR
jgi:Tol biopolymer transport system component